MNSKRLIEDRIKRMENHLIEIQADYRNNIKPQLLKLHLQPQTKSMQEEIENMINGFIAKNRLDILVNVLFYEQGVSIIGANIVDQIVWERIQQ